MSKKKQFQDNSTTRWNIRLDKDPAIGRQVTDMSPPGYITRDRVTTERPLTQKQTQEILTKKAWVLARSPLNSIFMVGLMMWMTPNTLNIFSISIAMFALWNPIKAILSTNQAFASFGSRTFDLLGQKLLYVLINLVALSLGVWKLSKFGLIPTTPADFISWYGVKQPVEYTGGGEVFIG
eukprot:TRINITY_DN9726_c0_g1_i1.p1 TRINITY_DN9726_c0_g1~~TRINITY_DN9726_c0_g1_i1.p1  ORF type:complete len:180 (+),score=26.11 TRINITY_DN9726_c0_g1_i1:87-626(+)